MRLDDATPFVLLDDARALARPARLYRDPRRVIRADRAEQVWPALAELEAARTAGHWVAGFLAYEAGQALAPRALPAVDPGCPSLWFGLFDSFEEIPAERVPALLPDPAGAWAGSPRPRISRETYGERFRHVIELIHAGDIYQANLTLRADVPFAGSPLALYAALRGRAKAGYGGVVWTGQDWLLSLSPELFFSAKDGHLTARPMKGTAPRSASPEEDERLARSLTEDPKQRAENLMIVDLLRNDLSRVAVPGSVGVPQSFKVETYPTVHQMVSTVTAELMPDRGPVDAIESLFPCGSITGAPKMRAMEIIAEIEAAPRGPYCGAIGRIDPDGTTGFNVAIRTLHIPAGAGTATLGLGGGIVADSREEEEWQEALAKGAFVTAGQRGFDLIETMAFDPEHGIPLLERHLARMKASALALGFSFDRHATRNELQAATFRLGLSSRVRLLLAPSGAIAIGIAPMPSAPAQPVSVAIAPLPVESDDFRLRHKTSNRGFYDRARVKGAFETVFADPSGHLTEGSFTSIFVERDGLLVTPPLARGLLPGVLRAELIESGRAVEGDLMAEDLRDGFLLGNALRGLIRAQTVAQPVKASL